MKKLCGHGVLLLITAVFVLSTFATAFATSNDSIVTKSGTRYIGDIVLDKIPSGKGEATWTDGSTYSGEFFDGMPHGKGTFTYQNGDVYVGEFEYGFRSGKGTMTFSNGDTYIGDWKADMMHGTGKYTFHGADPARPDKNDTYTGQWRYNMMHGKGNYRYANGTSTNGYWVQNQYRSKKLTGSLKAEIAEYNK